MLHRRGARDERERRLIHGACSPPTGPRRWSNV
jgi:hypothetical protein